MAIDGVNRERVGFDRGFKQDAAPWQHPDILQALAEHMRERGVAISADELGDRIAQSSEAQSILDEAGKGAGAGGVQSAAVADLAAKTRALEYYNELMQQMSFLEEQKRFRKTEKAESRYAQQKSAAAIEAAGKGGKARRVAAPSAQAAQSLEAMLQAILGISDGGGEAAAPAAPAATGGGGGGGGAGG